MCKTSMSKIAITTVISNVKWVFNCSLSNQYLLDKLFLCSFKRDRLLSRWDEMRWDDDDAPRQAVARIAGAPELHLFFFQGLGFFLVWRSGCCSCCSRHCRCCSRFCHCCRRMSAHDDKLRIYIGSKHSFTSLLVMISY